MDLFQVVSVEDAKKIMKENFDHVLMGEKVNLNQAVGRIIYEDIQAQSNSPEFRRSIVDGYSVNSRDTFGASEAIPSILNLKGEVLMGEGAEGSISKSSECFAVPTGGMVPDGADSVVMVEYTEKMDEYTILINTPVAPGENVVQIGEDVMLGEVLFQKGSKLRAYEIGVLASLGVNEITVYKKPKVGIISTGDEIVPIEEKPSIGQIRNINTHLLYASIQGSGGDPVDYGIATDEFEILKEVVEKALIECDMVLISGGSSVGKKDQTVKVLNSFEGEGVLIHGIAVKPGKPTLIGKGKGKVIFGLPGHPLACSMMYQILVEPYMHELMNFEEKEYPVSCKFSENYHKAKGREEYLPVTLETIGGEIIAIPVLGKSALISVYSKAWGYIVIDKNAEGVYKGQEVKVYSF